MLHPPLRLQELTHVAVLTGAGISAPSGIATYRDRGSGWTESQLEEKSCAQRYGNHLPELWQFWGRLRATTSAAEPNDAHLTLARWQQDLRARGGDLVIATQNIDGLHQRAGAHDVTELHGSIHRSRCIRCRHTFDDDTTPEAGSVPRCGVCGPTRGGRLRPDVVLFGEALSAKRFREVEAAFTPAQLCLYVGTSGNVHPAAGLVELTARRGGRCVLVNQDPWEEPSPAFTDTVLGDCAEILPDLLS